MDSGFLRFSDLCMFERLRLLFVPSRDPRREPTRRDASTRRRPVGLRRVLLDRRSDL